MLTRKGEDGDGRVRLLLYALNNETLNRQSKYTLGFAIESKPRERKDGR